MEAPATAPSPTEPALPAEPVDGRRALKAGSIHRQRREGEHFWSTRRRGFLPARDPLVTLAEIRRLFHNETSAMHRDGGKQWSFYRLRR